MQITFEVAAYKSAVSRITKVVTNPTSIFFKASGSTLTLDTYKDGIGASVSLAANVKKEGSFCTEFAVVKTIFNNKKTVTLTLAKAGNKVDFKTDSRLSGDFVTMESQEYDQGILPDMTGISTAQLEFIESIIKYINIEEFFFKNPLSVTVSFTKTHAYAIISSDFHQVYAVKEGKYKEMHFRMPYKSLASVIALASSEKFELGVTDAAVTIKANSFSCILPIENTQEDRFEDYKNLVENVLTNKPVGSFDYDEFKSCIESVMTIADSKANAEMSVTNKSLDVYIKTAKGTISESIQLDKCKHDSEPFSVNPKAVMDLVKNMPRGNYKLILTDRLVAFTTVTDDGVKYTYLNAMYSG